MQQYGFLETISNVYCLVYSRVFFPNARLIRLPFYLRGKSSFMLKKGFTCGHACRFDLPGMNQKTLSIGENVRIGDNVHIVAQQSVSIGDNCLFASKIFISDTDHGELKGTEEHTSPLVPPSSRPLVSRPVTIGKNVWIGENAVILSGVSIGDGCIIGANSVVNNDIPSYSIAAGVPARIIKRYSFEISRWLKI